MSNVEYNKRDTGALARGLMGKASEFWFNSKARQGEEQNALKLAAPRGIQGEECQFQLKNDGAKRVVERNLCEAGHLGIWQEPNAAIEW